MDSISDPQSPKPTLVEFPQRHREFVIEAIMPAREVHILAAASGAGKTTFIVQMLDDLIDELPVFERQTHRISPIYLCNDRSHADIQRTFERVKPSHSYPVYSLVTDKEFIHSRSVCESLRTAKLMHAECDFIVYDPISFNVENVNSSKEVATLLRSITKTAQELNVTVMVLHHVAKVKTDAGYANPRQKIAGSGAWGGYSNLNLILDEEDESDQTNPMRTLHVCPRNAANRIFRYMQEESGCFVPAPTNEADPARQRQIDDQAFNALPTGKELATHQLWNACGKKTNGHLERNIQRWCGEKALMRISRGKYQKMKNLTVK